MYCTNCGKPYEDTLRFCNYCGASVPVESSQATAIQEPETSVSGDCVVPDLAPSVRPLPPLAESPSPLSSIGPSNPSYAAFAGLLMAMIFVAAGIALFVGENKASGSNDAALLLSGGIVALLMLAGVAKIYWAKIRLAATQQAAQERIPVNLTIAALVMTLLFCIATGLFGAAIGGERKESIQLNTDAALMERLANKIGEARNQRLKTIPEFVSMYKSIGADVERYDSTLARLRVGFESYDRKFPDQHETWRKSLNNVNTEIRRAALLKKQIAVALRIDGMDDSAQWETWQSEMIPLLKAEDGLAN